MIFDAINELIEYESVIFNYPRADKNLYRNLIIAELGITNPKEFECDDKENIIDIRLPDPILDEIKEYLINELKLSEKEALIKLTKIMGLITPSNAQIDAEFQRLEKEDSFLALKYLYDLSIRNNYIQKSKVEKNILWDAVVDGKQLEVSINLSKPEKNVKDIAKLAASNTDSINYPKCQLCIENVGYLGRDDHPSKVNLRVIPLELDGERWYLQYSPYGYYNMHCIAFNKNHIKMIINQSAFKKLVDFVDRFPSFFIGSNADLPIVGGSILSHDHFQGGEHTLPIMNAKVRKEYGLEKYKNSRLFLLEWFNTALLLKSTDKTELVEIATKILNTWKEYTDETNEIIAHDEEGNHNTLTPSLKKIDGVYYLYLILRNNRTSYKYPEGIFHAHPKYYHIKKENIGIIEAMGLFILPARLLRQTEQIKTVLKDGLADSEILEKYADLEDFLEMIGTLRKQYDEKTIDQDIKNYINNVCNCILINTAVFKDDDRGHYGIDAFIRSCEL